MKLSLRIFMIFLAGLFVVSLIGCGQDTDDDGDDIVETVDGTTVVDIPVRFCVEQLPRNSRFLTGPLLP